MCVRRRFVIHLDRKRRARSIVRNHSRLILTVNVPLFDVSVPLVEMIVAWNAVKATVLHVGATKIWGRRRCTRNHSSHQEWVRCWWLYCQPTTRYKQLATNAQWKESVAYSSWRKFSGRLHGSRRLQGIAAKYVMGSLPSELYTFLKLNGMSCGTKEKRH